jgi:hypothetical protein
MNDLTEPIDAAEEASRIDEIRMTADQIAEQLNETNTGLLMRVVHAIGARRSLEILKRTLEIEAGDGLRTHDSERRRTPGGVFFFLVRGRTSEAERERLWPNREQTKLNKEEAAKAEAANTAAREAARKAQIEKAKAKAEKEAKKKKAAEEKARKSKKGKGRPGARKPRTGAPGSSRPAYSTGPAFGGFRPLQGNVPRSSERDHDEELPYRPRYEPLAWGERISIFQEIQDQHGVARIVSIRLIGRPRKVLKRKGVTIVTMTNPPTPPKLPRELPLPEQDETVYLVFIAARQWELVENALEDPQDQLIVTGLPVIDKKLGAITVLAQTTTTIVMDRNRRDYF